MGQVENAKYGKVMHGSLLRHSQTLTKPALAMPRFVDHMVNFTLWDHNFRFAVALLQLELH